MPDQAKTGSRTKGRADPGWADEARLVVAAVLARHGVSLQELARALKEKGLDIGYKSLSNKLARGTFSFAFFLEAMDALGIGSVQLSKDAHENTRRNSFSGHRRSW